MKTILIMAAMMFALSGCQQGSVSEGDAIFKEKGSCTKCVKKKCCKSSNKCCDSKKKRKCTKDK